MPRAERGVSQPPGSPTDPGYHSATPSIASEEEIRELQRDFRVRFKSAVSIIMCILISSDNVKIMYTL